MSTTASLYKSLAQSAPEIKECVDACNFIADNTREQNDIGSVSVCACLYVCVCTYLQRYKVIRSPFCFVLFYDSCFYHFSSSFSYLGDGELGVDRQDD